MTSAGKLRANRANSVRSTGPKTAAGRAASARNARRHGLTVPVLSDPVFSAEVGRLAQTIAGSSTPELLELARRIGEAEVDVLRIRRIRSDMTSRELTIVRWETPEHRELLKSRAWYGTLARMLEAEGHPIGEKPPGAKNLPPRFGPEFAIIDRYERRALSRRKFAVRAFDKARSHC